MDDLQQLESFTAQVREFNQAAENLADAYRTLKMKRDFLVEAGRDQGLFVAKVNGMLARIKCDVLMPAPSGGQPAGEAEANTNQADAADDDGNNFADPSKAA